MDSPPTVQLTFNQALPTHTSLQVNETQVTFASPTSEERTLRIVDVPGHPRIRSQFSRYLGDAKAVVFVVDTSSIARNGPVVAEYVPLCLLLSKRFVNFSISF